MNLEVVASFEAGEDCCFGGGESGRAVVPVPAPAGFCAAASPGIKNEMPSSRRWDIRTVSRKKLCLAGIVVHLSSDDYSPGA
jgi:hypothetical protein